MTTRKAWAIRQATLHQTGTHQERNATMRRQGFTLLELLILLAVLAIVFAIAALDVRPLNNEARNAANEVASAVRLTRARAMATTSAHRLVLASGAELRMEAAVACDDASGWTDETRFATTLSGTAEIAELSDTGLPADYAPAAAGDVLLCFDPRGLADASPTVKIEDGRGRIAEVDVYAGGGVELR
ncbi:MAG: prepilin-type N-terminal cleavage/methylation domain-containing protein [Trueperaceae bacterium]|nr:prepilin-type N-terminal cleavage/methylation domain-containing protein [Trueperaceae bacterium]